jgi:hypothetical protein
MASAVHGSSLMGWVSRVGAYEPGCTGQGSREWVCRVGLSGEFTIRTRIYGLGLTGLHRQSARIAYLSWKIEIARDWYSSQNGRDCGAKVKMCIPVHGIYV